MLSFANPLFLWGLLGLAAPLLIHLINRDLFRPLVFPSIRFILRGKLPVERKRRLRNLLLLALRMLLFAAIVTALARPQWQPDAAAVSPTNTEGELVILIDASASMSGWSSWKDAVTKAEELLAAHQPAPVGLVISGAGPLVVEPPTDEHTSLRAILNRSAPQQTAGDHREALRLALRLFRGDGDRTLAIISDFQQSDWSPASLPQADPGIQINWLQVGPEEHENTAILHARALPLADGRRQVVAEIRNFGQNEVERTVRLRAGDESPSRPVQLGPGENRSISFILEDRSASHAEVSIEPDAFPADDNYFLWLSRPPPIRVLIVAPTSEEPEKSEELFFLSRALITRTESQWLHFAVNAVEPGELTENVLQDVHAIFLLGAAPYLRSSEWELLHQHLEQGGRLLFTPGKAPARQTTLLADQGLIDLSYEGMAGIDRRQPRPHRIDWVLPDSPIDLLFRDDANRALSHVSIYQYVRLNPRNANEITLLRTEQEHPLIVQREVRSGLVYASAFPFQTAWTDFPVSTAFLPIIRELVAGDLPPDYGIVRMDTTPSIIPIAARLNVPIDHPGLANIDPLSPGIHVISGTPVVLNIPRSESIPKRANPIDLQTAVTPRNGLSVSAVSATDGDHRASLWPWLAMAALVMFILEMPLAARIRQARGAKLTTGPEITPEPATRE